MQKSTPYTIPLESLVITAHTQPQIQSDFILQKRNLGAPHQHSHPSLYMPSHGEFLVEKVAQLGLRTGLILGLDEFALRPELLNQSPAEVLIVCGADQHFDQDFLTAWKQVKKTYAYKVLITSEPIFSPLAFYYSETQDASVKHDTFLTAYQPHFVFYNSLIDLAISQKKYGQSFESAIYSMSDPDLLVESPLPWEQKAPVLGFWGKMTGWKYSRARSEAWHRQEQISWFLNQQSRMPVHIYDSPLSFRQCYGVVNRYRFQLQARSGYFFHSARIVQSALTGTVPIILLHKSYLPLLYEEAPFLQADHNILLGFDGAYDELLDKIQDPDLTARIHQNLDELLAFGTISACLEPLISRIFETFRA